jgi:hypothetical protein
VSVSNAAPVFSLVRTDSARYSEATSLRMSASPQVDYAFDEIALVDPNGEPCAMPKPGHQIRDNDYELIGGGRAWQRRVVESELSFAIDYIDNATRSRLQRWMMDRARVYLSPGYGPRTELAWRPTATPLTTDLTGRHALSQSIDGANSWVWDAYSDAPPVWRYYSGATARTVRTPFGAGQIFDPAHTNLFYSSAHPPGSYPVGAADNYQVGWEIWGSDSASLLREFSTTGFGCIDFPGAVRHYTATRLAGIKTMVAARSLNNAVVTGGGTAWCGVWLKGRFGSTAKLCLGYDGNTSTDVSLAGLDLSEWTLVNVCAYRAAWPATATSWIKIDVSIATGKTEACDFMIGPSFCYWNAGAPTTGWPSFVRSTRTQADALYATSFKWPKSGSAMYSLYVPKWWTTDATHESFGFLSTSGTGGMQFVFAGGWMYSPNCVLICYYGTGGGESLVATVNAASAFPPGKVATIATTWDANGLKIYSNGTLVATYAAGTILFPATSEAYFFGTGTATGINGLVPLSLRVENEVWSADEIANLHRTHADSGASDMIVGARGRVYQIVEVPCASKNVVGGVCWSGTLKLRQVDYVAALADATSKEV